MMTRDRHGDSDLVNLLDRVLEKGVVLKADVIITVADVPLLGLNLTALLAGMTTFLDYGVWEDWDDAHRAWAREHDRNIECHHLLVPDEKVCHLSPASILGNVGGSASWRPVTLLFTNRRLLCYRREPFEMFTETAVDDISWVIQDEYDDRIITITRCDGKSVSIRLVESTRLNNLISSMMPELHHECADTAGLKDHEAEFN
jgi:hypothetical protein